MRCNPGHRDDILPVDTIADLRPTQMLREPREFVMSMYGKQLEWLWRILIEWSGTGDWEWYPNDSVVS